MRARPGPVPAPRATARIALKIAGRPLQLTLQVPEAPARRSALLPVFRQVADAVVDIAVERTEAEGARISCRKGCGACCRQLVPIAEPEAHALVTLVAALPQPRRTAVLDRIAAARQRLAEAGLLSRLLHPRRIDAAELRDLGLEYFGLGIPCPFLEDESCSIHADRPIACREYLVTSPAAHCAEPSPERVRTVSLPGKVSSAVSRTGEAPATGTPWVPLVLALEWAGASGGDEPPRPARTILEEFFRHLTQ
jgi:Fe-S-cluster containining protein